MDVWNDRLLDIGLNTLGYLTAGGLGMLLYSVIRGRRTEKAAQEMPSGTPAGNPPRAETPQFVDLKTQVGSPAVVSASGRRDKTEMVRLARQLLKAGADRETIKRTVPISDGELNLLEVAGSVR